MNYSAPPSVKVPKVTQEHLNEVCQTRLQRLLANLNAEFRPIHLGEIFLSYELWLTCCRTTSLAKWITVI